MIHQVIPKICNKHAANWACFTFNRITFWLHEDKWRWDNIFSNKKITILLRYWEHFCVMLSLKEFMCRVYVPMAALITSWWTINIRTREWYSFMDIFVNFWRVGDTESKILLDRTWTWVSFDVSKKVTGIVAKLKKNRWWSRVTAGKNGVDIQNEMNAPALSVEKQNFIMTYG